jgi:hypothetical protein
VKLSIVCFVVLGFVVAASAPSSGVAARADSSFTDTSGDAVSGVPDIISVNVTDEGGTATFEVKVAGDLPLGSDYSFAIFLDTDANDATGATGTSGADFSFHFNGSDLSFALLRWTGAEWVDAGPLGGRVLVGSDGVTVPIERYLVGNPASFDFWVASSRAEPIAGQVDHAPDDGSWAYALAVDPADVTGPHLRLFNATGVAGKKIRLRYRAWDDVTASTRELITVTNAAGRVVFRFETEFDETTRADVWYVNWRPRRKAVGRFEWCVRSWDENGLTSSDCASVRVRRS